jgi:hypothetical protein
VRPERAVADAAAVRPLGLAARRPARVGLWAAAPVVRAAARPERPAWAAWAGWAGGAAPAVAPVRADQGAA